MGPKPTRALVTRTCHPADPHPHSALTPARLLPAQSLPRMGFVPKEAHGRRPAATRCSRVPPSMLARLFQGARPTPHSLQAPSGLALKATSTWSLGQREARTAQRRGLCTGAARTSSPPGGFLGLLGGVPHPHRLHLSSKDPGRPGAPMPHPWQPGPPLSCMPPPLLTLHHQPTAKSTQGSRHLPIHTRHGPWFPGLLWPPLPRPPELLVASALCHQLGPTSGIPDPTDIRLPHRLPAHHLPGPEPHTRRHCGLLRGGLPRLPDPQKTHL